MSTTKPKSAANSKTMLLGLSIMLTTLSTYTAGTRAEGSWCAMYTTGGNNCGLHSFEQCQATVSGVGGFCGNNPFYGAARETRRQKRSK
jgi:hypothetical protein